MNNNRVKGSGSWSLERPKHTFSVNNCLNLLGGSDGWRETNMRWCCATWTNTAKGTAYKGMLVISTQFTSIPNLKVLSFLSRWNHILSIRQTPQRFGLPKDSFQEKILLEKNEFPHFHPQSRSLGQIPRRILIRFWANSIGKQRSFSDACGGGIKIWVQVLAVPRSTSWSVVGLRRRITEANKRVLWGGEDRLLPFVHEPTQPVSLKMRWFFPLITINNKVLAYTYYYN